MVGDISIAENIYIACGKTDMRKSIDGLAALVQSQYHLDPFTKSIFLFCGGKSDRIKILMWEGDGFVLLYKRLESGRFRWPRNPAEVKPISWKQFFMAYAIVVIDSIFETAETKGINVCYL